MGCRIILLTSVNGTQGPERIKNLYSHSIYFDEAFFTRGRQKSEFANELLPRYVDSQGRPCKSILVDDYAKNVVEFVQHVPGALYGVTLAAGYGAQWLKKVKNDRRILGDNITPGEMYGCTLRCITKILLRRKK
jgi:hypothetical protein